MYSEYFIGDDIMYVSRTMEETHYTFLGAELVDDRWRITLAQTVAQGYAGGSGTFQWVIRPGDQMRLSMDMKAWIYDDSPQRKKRKKHKVSSVQFVEVQSDYLKLYFDLQ